MRDLNYQLKQLCARNRDGSYSTQANRQRILDLVARQLNAMGFRRMSTHSLKALVPKSWVNLTRYHGVLAPHHRWQVVTPAKRDKGVRRIFFTEVRSPGERYEAMTWAQRLKRVIKFHKVVCCRCG